jgi:hypothetical protein
MPLIKPRTRGKQFVRLITRLEHENNETLHAYGRFLGEPVEYVLNQLIDTVLARDKEFVSWRAEHQESCAPTGRAEKVPRPATRTDSTREDRLTTDLRAVPHAAAKANG